VDSMLGTVAKKMRILGFDCIYSATIDDEDLILVAKKENRIVITKDRWLSNNAKKHDILVVEITTHTEEEHIIEIAKKMNWEKYEFNTDRARCPMCNGGLQIIEKSQVVDKIPPKVVQNVDEFWICDDCNHIYWKGTHIRNLEKFIVNVNDQL
jgi:hypothetical protein